MASDYLLEIDGIKGESIDSKKADSVEIFSYSWGVSAPTNTASGTGNSAGKASWSDLSVTLPMSKPVPLLMKAISTGKMISKATLHGRKLTGADNPEEFLTITLEDVLVSSVQTSASSGGDSVPTVSVSLTYAKITQAYKPQKADGTLDAEIKANYDVKGSKAT